MCAAATMTSLAGASAAAAAEAPAAAAAAVAPGSVTTMAAAGSNGCVSVGGPDYRPGTVCFYHHGDKFKITDGECDNASVYYRYNVNGGSINRVDFDEGCNRSRTDNYNFPEGATIKFKVCIDQTLAPDVCSNWRERKA